MSTSAIGTTIRFFTSASPLANDASTGEIIARTDSAGRRVFVQRVLRLFALGDLERRENDRALAARAHGAPPIPAAVVNFVAHALARPEHLLAIAARLFVDGGEEIAEPAAAHSLAGQ